MSLFIHIMPPLVLHTLIHTIPTEYSHELYPALKYVRNLNLVHGIWSSSVVHITWQGWYYLFIMVGHRKQIVAGHPTSFTWLRKSYSKTWLGKWVKGLPEPAQFLAFNGIQVLHLIKLSLTTVRILLTHHHPLPDLVPLRALLNDIFVRVVLLVSVERCHRFLFAKGIGFKSHRERFEGEMTYRWNYSGRIVSQDKSSH